jgi:hypothetical protein
MQRFAWKWLNTIRESGKAEHSTRVFMASSLKLNSDRVLFFTDGNPRAVLVENNSGHHSTKTMRFPKVDAALDWCRKQKAVLVVLPASG